jgi:glycine/D-amino acid oxidase-like deaminating enzyme
MRWDVAIVGAGPAGLMAAERAAERGRKTILLDKNREPGVKILLFGGGRCNLTHATGAWGIVAAFGRNGRFLHSALAALGPQQVVDLFEAEGVPIKTEPDGKMFPASDRAADVRDALLRRAERAGCTLAMDEPLVELISPFSPGVLAEEGAAWTRRLNADATFQLQRRSGRSRRRRSCWPAEGNRIRAAGRPATGTVGRPLSGIASCRHTRDWCRLRVMPVGCQICRGSRWRMWRLR